MINPDHISDIVKNTLSSLGSKEPAMTKLIKATFAVESYLTDLYDTDKHGFMMMREERIDYTCKEYIRYKLNLKEEIHSLTGIDVAAENFFTLRDELDTNIVFMVCVLYAFYESTGTEIENDSLVELARIYKNYYNEDSNITVDDFGQTYVDVYVNW